MLGDSFPTSSNQLTISTTQVSLPVEGSSGWTVALIVIGSVTLVAALAATAYLLFRRIKDQRKSHGEYRPQFEESLHAKNLPYISPPNIEGLI